MSRNLAFKALLWVFSREIAGSIEVLTFMKVFKIYCKLCFKYLTIEEATKDLGIRLRVKSSSNLFILLLTKKEALDITFKRVKKTTKAHILQNSYGLKIKLYSSSNMIE